MSESKVSVRNCLGRLHLGVMTNTLEFDYVRVRDQIAIVLCHVTSGNGISDSVYEANRDVLALKRADLSLPVLDPVGDILDQFMQDPIAVLMAK
jgi:hypothetical protein